jgi:hypothetical protein
MRRPVDLDAKTVSCDSAGSMDGCTVGWSHENRSCWGHVSGTKPPAVPEPRACISSRLHSPIADRCPERLPRCLELGLGGVLKIVKRTLYGPSVPSQRVLL